MTPYANPYISWNPLYRLGPPTVTSIQVWDPMEPTNIVIYTLYTAHKLVIVMDDERSDK